MRFARLIQICAENKTERGLVLDAMDMIHDLGDPELAAVVAEFQSQREAVARRYDATGVLTLHVASARHLALALDMLREAELYGVNGEGVEVDGAVTMVYAADMPTLNAMFDALKAELLTLGIVV